MRPAAEIEAGIYQRQQAFCAGVLCEDLTYVVIKLVDAPPPASAD